MMALVVDKEVPSMRRVYTPIYIFFIAIRTLLKFVYHYSGLAFIGAKITSNKNEDDHPTFFIWLLTIYFGFYGLAVQRYERDVTRFQNRINQYVSFISGDNADFGFRQLETAFMDYVVIEPKLEQPDSVLRAFLGEKRQLQENLRAEISELMVSLYPLIMCKPNVIPGGLDHYDETFHFIEAVKWLLDSIENSELYEEVLLNLDHQGHPLLSDLLLISRCASIDASGVLSYDIGYTFKKVIKVYSIGNYFQIVSGTQSFFSTYKRFVLLGPSKEYRFLNKGLLYDHNQVWFGGVIIQKPSVELYENTFVFSTFSDHDRRNNRSTPVELKENLFFFSNISELSPSCNLLKEYPWNISKQDCKNTPTYQNYNELFVAYLSALSLSEPKYTSWVHTTANRLKITLPPESK